MKSVLLPCLWAAVMAWLPNGVSAAEDAALMLDETAYCREYIQFGMDKVDPAALKREGKQILSDKELASLKREVKQQWEFRGKPWDEAKWMDEAYVPHAHFQGAGDRGIVDAFAFTDAPPEGWMKTDFDDAGWVRQRMPLTVGLEEKLSNCQNVDTLNRRASYLRFHFNLSDPAQSGALTLKLVYHGGARVFVNGKEIARQHLPQGELGPDASGEVYPWQAYVRVSADGAPLRIEKGQNVTGAFNYIGDLASSFADAVPVRNEWGVPKEYTSGNYRYPRTNARGGFVDRQLWEKLETLRDRVLGPVSIPANLLRKGDNVLAVEVRASDLNPITSSDLPAPGGGAVRSWRRAGLHGNFTWPHAQLKQLDLRAAEQAPSSLARPAGVQVWVEDMHRRVMETEFNDKTETGTVRFVGALNGTFAAQVVVGADHELTGLKVMAGELVAQDGNATIPAAALSVSYLVPHPYVDKLLLTGQGRGLAADPVKDGPKLADELPVLRHGPKGFNPNAASIEEKRKVVETLRFFDHITEKPAQSVPANACLPLWLSLKIPASALPGVYRGALRVAAQGMAPVTVPVEANVLGWRLPDPKNFQTMVMLEHNPYGVARQYNVPLWSDEHFKRIEPSLQLLGRVGNNYLIVPAVKYSEFGNKEDTIIKWIRKKDGSLDFDYRNLDRYLNMVVKHWGRPRAIVFVVMHGAAGNKTLVDVLDEKSGKTEVLDLGSASPDYRSGWQAFAVSLYAHLQELKLEESLFWGLAWDSEGDPDLPVLMSQFTPGVNWAMAGHGNWGRHYFKCSSFIYNILRITQQSKMGWKRPDILVLNGRGGGTVSCIGGDYPPFTFRFFTDRALVSGANGIGRIGVDSWQGCRLP